VSLTLVLGVGIIASLFLVIAFKLDEEHGLLRFAFILFSLGLLFIIPAAVTHDSRVCEVVLTESVVDGNTTTNTYNTFCFDKTTGSLSFVKAVKYPYYLFVAYLLVYLFYKAALLMGSPAGRDGIRRVFRSFKK